MRQRVAHQGGFRLAADDSHDQQSSALPPWTVEPDAYRGAMKDPREGLNADGTIRTGAGRRRVPAAFEPIIAAVLEEFDRVAAVASELHLYGSVAMGTARAGRSDVDLVAIDVPADWCADAGRRLSARFSDLCRGVEIGDAHRSDYTGDGDETFGNRVFLRHYCVHLAGRDAVRSHSPFQGDARAARGFNGDIGARLAHWRTGGGTAQSIARKTLLAAAGVVSVVNDTWTTDRGTAADRWAEIEPDHARGADLLRTWVDDDRTATAAERGSVLAPGGIVDSVADRFAAEIGLWP